MPQSKTGINCLNRSQKIIKLILRYKVSYINQVRCFSRASDTIKEVREQIYAKDINWIIDADIEGFFNNIAHKLMRDFIEERIKDGGIIRLIGKWLKAGVVEKGELSYTKKGTPQGGVISPLLANIFLHYVLDEWFVEKI